MGWAYTPTFAPTRGPYIVPVSMARWAMLLSTDVDPHFPTIYAVTRLLSGALYFEGMPLEYFVRVPLVLLTLSTGGVIIWICLKGRPGTQGALLVSAILLVLVLDPGWCEHSAEARMYGLMPLIGIAMLCAIAHGRLALAAWMGFGLALLHPFGAMFGFAPAAMTLIFLQREVPRATRLGILVGLVLTAALVVTWILFKFILKSSSGYTAGGSSSDIWKVLAGLNAYAVGSAWGLATACVLAFRKRPGPELRTALLFLGILLSALVFVGLLLVLKPTTPPYERYVRWANPVLFVMSIICGLMLAQRAVPRALRIAGLPLTLVASIAAVTVTQAASFGPRWGNALREAALYLNAVADDTSIVTHDTFEIFDLPPWFRAGFRCFRAGQSVAYLSPSVRARMPCQRGNDVTIPDGVQQVYLIREPIAWAGPRQLHLEAFDKTATMPFSNAAIDVYRRRAE